MALQKNTLVLLGLALLLGGGVLIYERMRGSAPGGTEAASTTNSPLFNLKEEDVQAFTITSPEQTLTFERANQPGSPWQMKSPKTGPANDASVTFLLNLLATGASQKRLDVDAAQLQQFGLAPAKINVVVTLKNQQQHRLALGSPTFNQSGIYGQVDAPTTPPPKEPTAKVQVQILPLNFLNAVSRPLSEWEPAPAAPAPTPSMLVPPAPNAPAPTAPNPTVPGSPAPVPPAQESAPAPTAPAPVAPTPLPTSTNNPPPAAPAPTSSPPPP